MAYHCCGKWNCAEHHNGILSKKTVTMPYLTLFQIYILSLNKKRGDLILTKKKVYKAVQIALTLLLIVAKAVKEQSRTQYDD